MKLKNKISLEPECGPMTNEIKQVFRTLFEEQERDPSLPFLVMVDTDCVFNAALDWTEGVVKEVFKGICVVCATYEYATWVFKPDDYWSPSGVVFDDFQDIYERCTLKDYLCASEQEVIEVVHECPASEVLVLHIGAPANKEEL